MTVVCDLAESGFFHGQQLCFWRSTALQCLHQQEPSVTDKVKAQQTQKILANIDFSEKSLCQLIWLSVHSCHTIHFHLLVRILNGFFFVFSGGSSYWTQCHSVSPCILVMLQPKELSMRYQQYFHLCRWKLICLNLFDIPVGIWFHPQYAMPGPNNVYHQGMDLPARRVDLGVLGIWI